MTSLNELRTRFAPIITRIAANALEHEKSHTLPHAEVRALAEAGFGALRLPVAEGGAGLSLAEYFDLLLEVAAADSNQPQIWRNHVAFVEDRLQPEPADKNARWRKYVADGDIVGGAWSERGNTTFADTITELSASPEGWRLNGAKYYSTGSNFADWISVAARREDDGNGFIALVDAQGPGVGVDNDWTGFGQTTTGSGTSRYSDVAVDEEALYLFAERAPYQEALFQLVHVTTLAGIARAAHRDAVRQVHARTRSYPHGLAKSPREDAQVQAVIGRVGALASSAEGAVSRGARVLDVAAEAAIAGRDADTVASLVDQAAVAVYEAQVTASEDVLAATTLIFDALGSSAVDTSLALDRHWRNARTIASHNPRVYKERLLGAWYLNGTRPVVYGDLKAETATGPSSTSGDAEQGR
jgi:alkylation response protein AidB-like acyl-CoA dehydrogenase